MEHWWKRRRTPHEDVVDLRSIDDVITIRLDAPQDAPAQAPEREPSPEDVALDAWERSAALVEYPPDIKD